MEQRNKASFDSVSEQLTTIGGRVSSIETSIAVSFVNQTWFKWLLGVLGVSLAGAAIKYIFT